MLIDPLFGIPVEAVPFAVEGALREDWRDVRRWDRVWRDRPGFFPGSGCFCCGIDPFVVANCMHHFDSGWTTQNITVFCADLDGNTNWTYDLVTNDAAARVGGVAVDSVGNIYAFYVKTGGGYIASLTSAGAFRWETLVSTALSYDSTNEGILGSNVDVDADDFIYAGIFDSSTTPDNYLTKLDSDGNIIWLAKDTNGYEPQLTGVFVRVEDVTPHVWSGPTLRKAGNNKYAFQFDGDGIETELIDAASSGGNFNCAFDVDAGSTGGFAGSTSVSAGGTFLNKRDYSTNPATSKWVAAPNTVMSTSGGSQVFNVKFYNGTVHFTAAALVGTGADDGHNYDYFALTDNGTSFTTIAKGEALNSAARSYGLEVGANGIYTADSPGNSNGRLIRWSGSTKTWTVPLPNLDTNRRARAPAIASYPNRWV